FNLERLRVDYVRAKCAAEQVAAGAAARGRHVVIVNPGYLLGPEDYELSVMGRLCARFWRGRILVAPPGGYNVVDVRDVATGHLLAAEHGRPGRRYILGGENYTLPELFRLLARAAGWRPRALIRLPRWSILTLGTPANAGGPRAASSAGGCDRRPDARHRMSFQPAARYASSAATPLDSSSSENVSTTSALRQRITYACPAKLTLCRIE